MKKFFFLPVVACAMFSCQQTPETVISVRLEGTSADTPVAVVTADSTYTASPDSTGIAVLKMARNLKAGYGTVSVNDRLAIPVYIQPGGSFDLTLRFDNRRVTPGFKGEGGKVNEYLNGKSLQRFYPDFKLDEEAFLAALKEQENQFYAALDSLAFDEEFVHIEKQRLHYLVYGSLSQYPSYHGYYAKIENYQPSARFYEVLKTEVPEDASLIGLKEYQEALVGTVNTLVEKDRTAADQLEAVKGQLDYVQKNIVDPAVAEYLVHQFAYGYVSQSGVDHLDVIAPVYKAKVKAADKKAAFEALTAKWKKVAKGQPSPGFTYQDINGKEVSLSDLAGKYVYIDVWATWCGPCRGELPALQELEHQFEGKNITFVSISCDQDKAAWEKMVKEEKLGGVQLLAGANDDEFMKVYMIAFIPRFILLDKEGKIVDCKMTRPSNPQTAERLGRLEGI